MTSTNNRTINGYETIEGELVLSEITNSVLVIFYKNFILYIIIKNNFYKWI